MQLPVTRPARPSNRLRLVAATAVVLLAMTTVAAPVAAFADDPPPTLLTLTDTVVGGSADPASWSLAAYAPTGALPGPSGTTGSAGATGEITPGVSYALAESGGDLAYYQLAGPGGVVAPLSTISWQCNQVDENGTIIPGYADGLNGLVTVPAGWHVRCNAINKPRATVTVEQENGQQDPTTDSPIHFTVTFSEPVSGFGSSGVVLGGTAGASTASVTGGPTTFTAAVSGMTQPGSVTLSVPAGAATNADGATTSASTSVDNLVQWTTAAPSDGTNPVVTCASPRPVFFLNQSGARVYAHLVDETAPTTPQLISKAASTSQVGARTVTVAGTDAAGNPGSAVCGYSVVYRFAGFAAPVKNWPQVNTSTRAGQTIALYFAVADKYGRPVTTLPGGAVPISTTCQQPTRAAATSATSLRNLGYGHYRFDVTTPRSWAGSCRVLGFRLADGVPHVAAFQLRW